MKLTELIVLCLKDKGPLTGSDVKAAARGKDRSPGFSFFLPTCSEDPQDEGVGKRLTGIYEAMLEEYRRTRNKEEGARRALEIYYAHEGIISSCQRLLGDILDLKTVLEESLRQLEEQRAQEEARAVRIRSGGCLVVKLVPCGKHCRGCPHGPYLYRVVKVGGRQIWKYLGRARRK